MSNVSVVVHDIDKLESFKEFLQLKREETDELIRILETKSEEQGENWQDPQYEEFMDKIEEYIKNSKKELENFDDAIAYVVDKLNRIKNI